MPQPVIKISVSHSQDSVSTLTFIFATTRTYRPNVPRLCLCCLLYHGGNNDQSLPHALGASPELPLLPALDRTLKITRTLGEQRQRVLFVLLRSRCGITCRDLSKGFLETFVHKNLAPPDRNRTCISFWQTYENTLPQSDNPCSLQHRTSSTFQQRLSR